MMVRAVNWVSVPCTVSRESSTIVGTWIPCSPNAFHRPMNVATSMTGTIDHHVTPTCEPTSHATLMPSTTAMTRFVLAPMERTIVRSTTSSADIGA